MCSSYALVVVVGLGSQWDDNLMEDFSLPEGGWTVDAYFSLLMGASIPSSLSSEWMTLFLHDSQGPQSHDP